MPLKSTPSEGRGMAVASFAAWCAAAALLFGAYHFWLEWRLGRSQALGALTTRQVLPLHTVPHFSTSLPWMIPAFVLLGGFWWMIPRLFLARPPRASRLVPSCALLFALIAVAVSLIDGYREREGQRLLAFLEPYSRTHLEYYGDVPRVDQAGDPVAFLRKYTKPRFFDSLSLHTRTHPPGGVLFLWLVSRLFGPGLWAASLASIAFTTITIALVYALGCAIYEPTAGRIAVALFMLAPSAVLYTATSMDGPFTVFPAMGLWLFVRACRSNTLPWRTALASGTAFALAFFMTYATVVLLIFLACWLVLLTRSRPARRLGSVAAVAAAAFAIFYLALWATTGFSLWDAIQASRHHDEEMLGTGYETLSHFLDISVANLAAFLLGSGIALSVGGLIHVRRSWPRRTRDGDPFAAAAALTFLVCSFSTLFTLEVERIWLLALPLLVLPVARAITLAPAAQRPALLRCITGLLALQTLAFEITMNTPW